jgi:aspartyl-tRNA(Asn)/glutamyl-tRNA(Gln) amidotransferase subunit A
MSINKESSFLEWSISELGEAIRTKQISPVEVVKDTVQLIQEKDSQINAFITVMEEEAMNAAQQAEADIQKGNYLGPLHGVPIGLKDLIYTKGTRTTFGSEIYKEFVPDFDAEIVSKLKAAGAIIIGKLNTHQFAYGGTGDRSYFGPSRNPYNLSKITGGSSAGSGAAVIANLCYGAIGTDTGGSVRIPASCCGIVGMKPTFGRVSKHGIKALGWSLDHPGPMTRTVTDNAIMFHYLVGYDHKDLYSVPSEKEDFIPDRNESIRARKIGIPTSFYFDIIDPEVSRVFEQNVQQLKMAGAEIIDIDLPHMHELHQAQQVIMSSEAYHCLEYEVSEHADQIEPEVLSRIMEGKSILATDYVRMQQVRRQGIQMFMHALEQVDVIFTPTLGLLPFDIDQREVMINGVKQPTRIINRLTGPCDTIGFPAVSVPGGFSSSGLPIGVQLIGKPMDEKKLYQFAYAVEQLNQVQQKN